jgi:hypothetical protein
MPKQCLKQLRRPSRGRLVLDLNVLVFYALQTTIQVKRVAQTPDSTKILKATRRPACASFRVISMLALRFTLEALTALPATCMSALYPVIASSSAEDTEHGGTAHESGLHETRMRQCLTDAHTKPEYRVRSALHWSFHTFY